MFLILCKRCFTIAVGIPIILSLLKWIVNEYIYTYYTVIERGESDTHLYHNRRHRIQVYIQNIALYESDIFHSLRDMVLCIVGHMQRDQGNLKETPNIRELIQMHKRNTVHGIQTFQKTYQKPVLRKSPSEPQQNNPGDI